MPKHSPPLREEQVTQVFRALAEEHVRGRRKDRDVAEQAWRRIQQVQSAELAGIRRVPAPERPSGRWKWLAVPALALAAAAGGAFAVSHSGPPQLDYQLVGGTSQGELITTEGKPAKLLFSDDSSIEAASETTVSVHLAGPSKLVARLAQGRIKVDVAPRPDKEWRFLAGPYEVQVVGTRFDLSWDSQRDRLALVMHQGRVLVRGPGQEPRRVTAGEVLILDDQQSTKHTVAVADDPEDGEAPLAATPTEASGNGKPSPSPSAGPSWAQQVAAGQFDQVVQDAKKHGVEAALAQKPAGELQALAQAARYTGDTGLSVQTWSALRKRFTGQPAGVQAAFFLGRIYDQLGRGKDALTWFDTYLAEAPTGVYASETLGRKLTLVRSLRGEEKAHEVAREYLGRFPHGPYADTARDMLLND